MSTQRHTGRRKMQVRFTTQQPLYSLHSLILLWSWWL